MGGGEGTGRGQMRKLLRGTWGMREHANTSQISSRSTGFRWWIEALCSRSAAHSVTRAGPGAAEVPALAGVVPSTWNALALDPSRFGRQECGRPQ